MNTLLLDRDGVLIEERAYDYTPENIRQLPGVVEGLRMLSGFRFFVVSNQSAVGRGLVTLDHVEAVNEKLCEMLRAEGIVVEDILTCPHRAEDHCPCRKPKPGLWEQLVRLHGLKSEDCVMVGNRGSDVSFGRNIGCFTVMIPNVHPINNLPDIIVPDLPTLARFLQRHPKPYPLVMTLEETVKFSEKARKDGKRVITTNGSFDLLHPGHRFLLEEAKKHGDVLIVGVNSDASVRRYKGKDRPVEPEAVRALKVAAHADAVFVFDDDDPRPWLPKIRPSVHVNAETYGKECIEASVLTEIGAELILVPVKSELGSTTEILQKKTT